MLFQNNQLGMHMKMYCQHQYKRQHLYMVLMNKELARSLFQSNLVDKHMYKLLVDQDSKH